jgi:hypothetical protein
MATLHVYIINAKHLSLRREKIKALVKLIADMYPHVVIPKFITTNDPADLEPKLQELNGRTNYAPCGDPDFDQGIQMLNIETISNMYKHVDAWRSIGMNPTGTEGIHLVIEDDCVILQDTIMNLRNTLNYVANAANTHEWDMMFLGMAQTKPPVPDDTSITPLKRIPKMIPSKEAYFINHKTAVQLMDEWGSCSITHSLRLQLSKYLYDHPEIQAVFPDVRVTVDGSKLGVCPSTINGNNVLIFSGPFMEMFMMLRRPAKELKDVLPRAKELYASSRAMNSPDIMHIYGIILYKTGHLDEAEELMVEALDQVRKGQGLLNNRCSLSQNIINLYKDLQRDVVGLAKKPSKYTHPSTIPLKD